ncbi:MAG: 50S ribosomal protein L1 [Patescibacteria group bacterium]|nr:50S ribosomal protein L1 [Patescibacteria group bacterium]MDD5121610.1 50S ribosomal protein L1 [Patescibacteria group bacterium]MDD5222204.1 50S ribosomal protein L1 [Patescibacteria group bacterium]MDD5396226.1 50S ribosomal protein L1 [Patescibacteria group bacterium]
MARGKKYQEIKAKVNINKAYTLDEVIDFIKNNHVAKFDESIELHIKLGIDPTKTEQNVHGSVVLPSGSLKKKRIAVFATPAKIEEAKSAGADIVGGQELIEQIKASGKCDFDVAIAEPAIMKDLAQVAKVLGPKGLMPTPKTEAITTDFKKTIAELSGGKTNFKSDASGIVHQAVARISWPTDKIKANIVKLFEAVKKSKPSTSKGIFIQGVTIASTMGPGLKVQL